MSSGGNIGPKIGIEGEAQFKREINQINTSLKTMGTEMDKVTSAFIGNEKSMDALTAKNEVLQKKMDELNKKADVQRARLSELDKQGVDPTSASYQKLVQDLNKTETEMNKTEAEIKRNTTEMDHLGDETEETAQSLDKGGEAAKRMGDNLKANLLSEAIIAGVKALADGIKKLGSAILDAAADADELASLSVKTGIATDELQKFKYASESIDVSVDTLTGSYTKLTKQMASAASGTGAAADAFKKLGVEVKNSDGSFRDRNEVFQETIAALGEIPDEVERDAMAMEIFGKSAQELNPLIKGGAEALQELGQHAEEAGLILSGDQLNSLATLNDKYDQLKQTVSMVGQGMLASFAGPLTNAIETLIGYVERLSAAFKKGGFAELATEAGTIITEITQKLTQMLPSIVEFGTKMVLSIVEGIVSMLPDVMESAITIVTTLANSIAEALPELIPVAVQAILELVDTLTNPESISNLVDAAIAITIALANGLIQALPQLISKAPEIIANLVSALIENVPKLLMAAYEVIKTLVTGIAEKLPEIGAAAGEIVGRIVKGIIDLASTLWDTGKQIVMGIWEGIKNAGDWLWNQVKGFFGNLLDQIKDFLGIHSPSTLFANVVGKNMALGIGVGFDKAMEGVERDMMAAIPVPTVDATVNGADGAVMGGVGSGYVEEITIPVIVGEVELARALYRHIVGEGNRLGPAMVM